VDHLLMSESMLAAAQGWRPTGICSLFLVDIASFGDVSRTDDIRGHMRTAMYAGLKTSFDSSGIAFARCYREDRGDGAMVAVPPGADTAVLLTSVAERLRAEVRLHNACSSESAQMRLRVAVHTGEVRADDNGLVGTAVNHAFRILDAAPFKEVLKDSGAGLALIVSDRVHEDVVKHGAGLIDPEDYRPVDISVKETETTAWVRVPGMRLPAQFSQAVDRAESGNPQGAGPNGRSANQLMFELVDLALEIPLMRAERGRDRVVDALSPEISGVIPRSADARSDVYSLIRTCLDYRGGLEELRQALKGFVGDSMAMHRFEQTIARLLLQE
jgi:hypothetical protein